MKKTITLAVLALAMCGMFASCKKDNTTTGPDPEPTYRTEILAAPYAADYKSGDLLILDEKGDTLQHKKLTTAAFDFRRWIVNRQVRYTYTEYSPQAYIIKNVNYMPGSVVLLDGGLNEITRFSLLPGTSRTATDPNTLDGHDFILLDENHYITMAYYEQNTSYVPPQLNADPTTKVVAPVIQEVSNGSVVWEWYGGKYPEFYTSSYEGNDFSSTTSAHDYMHMTGMLLDEKDNNIILSLRNLNQIVKIDRATGKIAWRLGGKNSDFYMLPNQQFIRQNQISFADGGETLVVFDNGDATRPYSRIMEYKLDETIKKVTEFKSFTVPGSAYCQYMGSVQKTDSTYFIGGGSVSKIWEVNLKTGLVTWEKILKNNSYRAYKY
jgi:hypothetical protein